jgi:hypothetical protein
MLAQTMRLRILLTGGSGVLSTRAGGVFGGAAGGLAGFTGALGAGGALLICASAFMAAMADGV